MPQMSWSLEPPKTYTKNIQHLNPKSQKELPVRTMMDSYSTAILPLAEDVSLRDYYILSDKKIRFGRLLEDLDTFAVWIGYKHNQKRAGLEPGKIPFNMVTALVDKITLADYSITTDRNIKFSGMTTWVGTTSMEITMKIEQMAQPLVNSQSTKSSSNTSQEWCHVLETKFLMVARDRSDPARISVFVNPLPPFAKAVESSSPSSHLPMTKDEEHLFGQGALNHALRRAAASRTLLKMAPSAEEREIMHQLFSETIDPLAGTFKHRFLPHRSRWMHDTLVKTVIICHPQERNLNNTIFGGFLMRQAYELGWVTAFSFMRIRPKILRVDDVVFKQSVSIGSILYLSGQVVYTSGKNVMVKVHSEMKNMETGNLSTCNIMHFLFQPSNIPLNDHILIPEDLPPRVIPQSYSEMMLYIMGKRHFIL
ncbi:unnamed protein product [Gordionus sp. m RMFG-2023]|uniref:acyl-coenzyme A thioesterase 9, mitochondrial-like n=1 Tax=Gordionus sp. m RMFG-2023 TaxID=3053472 RepID=UPI0030E46907